MAISNFGISQTSVNLNCLPISLLNSKESKKQNKMKPTENASETDDSYFDHSNFYNRRKGAHL